MNEQIKQYVCIIMQCFYRKAWGDSTDVGTVEELWGPDDNKVTTTSASSLVSLLVHSFIFSFVHLFSRLSIHLPIHPFFHLSIHSSVLFLSLLFIQPRQHSMPTHLEIGQVPATTTREMVAPVPTSKYVSSKTSSRQKKGTSSLTVPREFSLQ